MQKIGRYRIIKKLLFTLIVSFFVTGSMAQTGALHRIFTFGNVADIPSDSQFFNQLENLLNIEDAYTVLITGDLINGDASKDFTDEEKNKIKKLLEICQRSEKSKVIILSGDRDWDDSGERGLKSIKKLKKEIESLEFERVEWLISSGCPGPESIDLTDELVLIGIETQWWNHPYDKPLPADGDCKIISETDFLSELDGRIEDAEGKNIIVAGHYPLLSVGEYGGKSRWTKHISPPIIGSMKVAFHQNIGTSKSIKNERFDHIRKKLLRMVQDKGSIIYISGHEHNIQVLSNEDSYLINSGSPTSPRHVGRNNEIVEYAEATAGIVEIYYYQNGMVDYRVHKTINEGSFILHKNETLFNSACSEHGLRHPTNNHFVPCAERLPDNTGSTSALLMTHSGGKYKAGFFTTKLLGKHYRDTWTADVNIPFLDLKQDKSGLTVYEKGGGRQTTSLKMKGNDGREYVFRSVDKNPTRVLEHSLKETIIGKVLQDATSMQHPYGAMAISVMLDETDILHSKPELFILPDNHTLGGFQKDYAGLFGMLEEKPINPKKVEKPFADADKILQSYKMMREQYNDHDHIINMEEYAQARMFDILVGDWGRHQDNWKWAGFKEKGSVTYRPIPRDRDHVFSRWDGFLPYLADRKWGKASGENFNYKIHDMRSLTWQTRHSDRFWLNEASKQDWVVAAGYIQGKMTDDVIDRAIRNMPKETLELSGLVIAEKLKQRRDDLQDYAIEYYELLAEEVDVVGSNKKEIFVAERQEDYKVKVTVYDRKDKGEKGPIVYERLFDPKETKEIRLYGLDGNDDFFISGNSRKSIRIRVIGGPGKDDINDDSDVECGAKKTLIYENNDKSNILIGNEGKLIKNADPTLYNYERTRFKYNRYGPIAGILFNSTIGFGIVAGVNFTNQRFGKKDFSTKHSIRGKITTEDVAILSYKGRYRHVIRNWDLRTKASISDKSAFVRFYGIGNGISLRELDQSAEFYNTQFNNFGFNVGLIRDFWKRSYFVMDAHYENNSAVKDEVTILEELPAGLAGLNDANLYEAIFTLDMDFRDRASFSSSGMRLWTQHQFGINKSNNNEEYFISQMSLENHSTFKVTSPWTISTKIKGSTSSGQEVIPFYKMVYLGQNSGLRGFENNRFTGTSVVSFNSELRVQLTNLKSTAIPIKLGVKAFFDAGRVYSDFDVTEKIFTGYGGGIYIVPYTESLTVNVSYGISEEENGLILLSIGSSFR